MEQVTLVNVGNANREKWIVLEKLASIEPKRMFSMDDQREVDVLVLNVGSEQIVTDVKFEDLLGVMRQAYRRNPADGVAIVDLGPAVPVDDAG